MSEFLIRIWDRLDKTTLLLFSLLAGTMLSIAWGFMIAIPWLELPYTWIVMLSIGSGWLLARTRLRLPAAIFLAAAVGAIILLVHFGNLYRPIYTLVQTWAASLRRVLFWDPNRLPDFSMTALALNDLGMRASILLYQFGNWSGEIITDQIHLIQIRMGATITVPPRVTDRLMVNVLWSIVMWLTSFWATWGLQRWNNPLTGVAPALILLAFTLDYTKADTLSLLSLLSLLLPLIAMTCYLINEQRWRLEKIDFAEGIRMDMAIAVGLLTVGVVLFATLVKVSPDISVENIRDFVNQFRAEQESGVHSTARSLGLEQQSQPTKEAPEEATPVLPRSHLLGSGPELSERVVMNIRMTDLSISAEKVSDLPLTAENAPRYYWKAYTFDKYINRGWVTTWTEKTIYEPDGSIYARLPDKHRLYRQEIIPEGNRGGVLFTVGDLLKVNLAFETIWRPVNVWEGAPPYLEGATDIDIFASTAEAEPYIADSLKPIVSEDRLQQAGFYYPTWVQQRYLLLPELPERVLTLAYRLTDELETPYEKALAIENYLRQLPYTLDVPKPPLNRDVADYFLFDLQRGYCDYYATAMVVLTRINRIPSRLVIGYTSSKYDPETGFYILSEADAHSWVEVYFPGVGWVDFEPTAGRPSIQRPKEAPEVELPEYEVKARGKLLRDHTWQEWVKMLFPFTFLLIPVMAAASLWDTLRLHRMHPQDAMQQIYKRLYQSARPLTGVKTRNATPLEFSNRLQSHLLTRQKGKPVTETLKRVLQDINNITELYTVGIYSSKIPGRVEISRSLRLWRRLRWRLWLMKFTNRSKG